MDRSIFGLCSELFVAKYLSAIGMSGVGYLLGQLPLGVVDIVTSLWPLAKSKPSSVPGLQAQVCEFVNTINSMLTLS